MESKSSTLFIFGLNKGHFRFVSQKCFLFQQIRVIFPFCSTSSGRGYLNHMATLRPNSASGQLSDPDSGCFSSHSNEAPGGWLEPHFGPASVAANGGIMGGVPIPMLIDSSSSPLSSSSSMSHHQPQQIPNNKLLAHTLENRKRVLHTLIREKTDTLV